ncbi:hypothetical protein Btru_043463 [Bulinus truncatus]|nr:hypothetical protein Btru_043463 [Bulinus truncatus]
MSGKIPENLEELDRVTLHQSLRIIQSLGRQVNDNISLDEAKLIIKSALWGDEGLREFPSFVDENVVRLALEENVRNRGRLRTFFTEAKSFLESLPQPFKDDLNFWHPGYQQNLQECLEELSSTQCLILVAGEKCSGKSSLINLLIGEPLLPTDILGCTETIVEIRYGQTPLACLYYKEDRYGNIRPPKQLSPRSPEEVQDFIQREVKAYITERHQETDQSPYDRVILFWPLKVLQDGVVIVDSPGISDKMLASKTLLGYLKKACAFLYVIDATSAINRYMLCNLLMKVSEANEGFDSSAAIFICSHWEQIDIRDSDRVLCRFLDILGFMVPGIQKSQIYPLPMKKALLNKRYGLTLIQYEDLTKGIKSMLPHSMRSRLGVYYRFLSELLRRSLYTLRIGHKAQTIKFEDIKSKYMDVQDRIDILKNRSHDLLKKIKDEIKKFSRNVGSQIHTLVHSTSLSFTEISKLKGQNWKSIGESMNTMIKEKVANLIDDWEKEKNIFRNMIDKVFTFFKKQLKLLEYQALEIKGILLDGKEMEEFVDDMRSRFCKSQSQKMNRAARFPIKCSSILEAINKVGKHIPILLASDLKLLGTLEQESYYSVYKLTVVEDLTRTCNKLQRSLDFFYVDQLIVTEFTSDQINLQEELGDGQFGLVYKAELLRDNDRKIVAVKQTKTALSTDDVTECLLEVSVLRDVCHKNIVQFHGIYKSRENNDLRLFLVLDYCPFTLRSRCDKNYSPSVVSCETECGVYLERLKRISHYIISISKGLAYLHHKSVSHRDLKPENILITEDDTVKIADFGMSRNVKFTISSPLGTLPYMAPEILSWSGKYDNKVDIYSLGMIVWELWYGKDIVTYAFTQIQDHSEIGSWQPNLHLTSKPPSEWSELMQKCWSVEPHLRPSASEIAKTLTIWFTTYCQSFDLDFDMALDLESD